MKHISDTWFSGMRWPYSFGIVVMENEIGTRKAYIGVSNGGDRKKDIEDIIAHGAPVHAEALREIASQID